MSLNIYLREQKHFFHKKKKINRIIHKNTINRTEKGGKKHRLGKKTCISPITRKFILRENVHSHVFLHFHVVVVS